MRVVLVGADFEENLALGMIGAALEQAGHLVRVAPFLDKAPPEELGRRILREQPDLVGLAIQFQHRCVEYLELARALRRLGYRGHITCGGQHPTMAYRELLSEERAVDSAVLHEGERTVVELAQALAQGDDLLQVRGLACRDTRGQVVRTAARPLCAELDTLPFAMRYRAHTRHLGMPFIPIYGSRGCWGSCAFCAITTAHRAAKEHMGSRSFRLRSVENLAQEMAELWHAEKGPCIFCFHDDTLLLPRPEDSLKRLRALRERLTELGVGAAPIIGKCRPDCVTEDLAVALKELGVFRMFVGIENGSQRGLDHLNRRTTLADLHRALAAFHRAGVYVCYNLLLFEPRSSLQDIRDNIAFIRRYPNIPVNFCRAEPYHGTPLHQQLTASGSLFGSYLGWDYRIAEDRVELAFRIAAAVFHSRNFEPMGVANRTIGTHYFAHVLVNSRPQPSQQALRLLERSEKLSASVSFNTADLLERVVDMAESADLADHRGLTERTARLGLEVAAHDRLWHAELDQLLHDIEVCADAAARTVAGARPSRRSTWLSPWAVTGYMVTAALPACGGDADDDNTAGTSGRDDEGQGGNAGNVEGSQGGSSGESMSYDGGAPPSGGRGQGGMVVDPAPGGRWGYGGGVADPSPGGTWGFGGWTGDGGFSFGGVADMVPEGGRPIAGGAGPGGHSWGGSVDDPVPGGTQAIGGWGEGGGPVDPAPGGTFGLGGRTFGGMNGDGGAPPQGGQGEGGYEISDMVPQGGQAFAGEAGRQGEGGYEISDMVPQGGQAFAGEAGRQGEGGYEISDMVPQGGQAFTGDPEASAGGYVAVLGEPDGSVRKGLVPAAAPSDQGSRVASGPRVVEHWRSTTPTRIPRSNDLPLYIAPQPTLRGRVVCGAIDVTLAVDGPDLSACWDAEGSVEVDGAHARWVPSSPRDQLAVAVVSPGGVGIATLRASDVLLEQAGPAKI